MSNTPLTQLEYQWYATRSGLSGNNVPLVDHKWAYYVSKGFGATGKTLRQMELEWLRSVAGSAGSGSYHAADLWREACVGQSVSVPAGASFDDIRQLFFVNVSGTP